MSKLKKQNYTLSARATFPLTHSPMCGLRLARGRGKWNGDSFGSSQLKETQHSLQCPLKASRQHILWKQGDRVLPGPTAALSDLTVSCVKEGWLVKESFLWVFTYCWVRLEKSGGNDNF